MRGLGDACLMRMGLGRFSPSHHKGKNPLQREECMCLDLYGVWEMVDSLQGLRPRCFLENVIHED